MDAGVPTSHGVIAERSPGSPLSSRHGGEWSVVCGCWKATSAVGRLACAVSVVLATLSPVISSGPWAGGLAVAVLVPAVLVDVHEHRLPDLWVGSAGAVLLVGIGYSMSMGVAGFAPASIVLGATMMAGPLLVVHLVSPTSMGFGDVKAAMVLGAALGTVGWQLSLVALAVASGATTVVAVGRRRRHIAFGPGLVGGTIVALLSSGLLEVG